MGSTSAYFKIGVFVLSGFFLGIATIVILGAGAMFQDYVLWETYVDESVQGLDVGAPVKYRGVKIGTVKDISFVENKYGSHKHYILLTCTFIPGSLGREEEEDARVDRVKREIQEGLRVRIASGGLTGGAYLELDYSDPKKHKELEIDWTPDMYYIPSMASTGLRITEAAENVINDVREADIAKIGAQVSQLVETVKQFVEKDLATMLKNIENSSQALTVTIRNIDEVFTGDTLKELNTFARSLNRLTEEELTPTLANIREVSEDLPITIDRLNRTVRKIDQLVIGQEANLEGTLEHLRVVLDDLRVITSRAQKYSSQLLFGPPPPKVKRGRK